MTKGNNGAPKAPVGRARFYKAVTVAAVNSPSHRAEGASSTRRGDGFGVGGTPTADVLQSPPSYPSPAREQGRACLFRVLLDGKPVRTPAKNEFLLPTRALADAVAAEWEAQTGRIDPVTMPLTKFANSAIDGVMGREAEVRADIVKYAGSDLVCYRAEGPPELIGRQVAGWDPVLAWSRDALGASFQVVQGITPAAQPEPATASVARAIEAHGVFDLAALHVMTTLMGSALLALAHARGHLSADQAWSAAHIDEDWQISRWGEDAEAKARREQRWLDMRAASRLMQLLG